jgi:hypothetical protein
MMVEELIESANPKYDGLIPPDYKFYTYGGGRIEMIGILIEMKSCQKDRNAAHTLTTMDHGDSWKM